jgi:hypothetical protein
MAYMLPRIVENCGSFYLPIDSGRGVHSTVYHASLNPWRGRTGCVLLGGGRTLQCHLAQFMRVSKVKFN